MREIHRAKGGGLRLKPWVSGCQEREEKFWERGGVDGGGDRRGIKRDYSGGRTGLNREIAGPIWGNKQKRGGTGVYTFKKKKSAYVVRLTRWGGEENLLQFWERKIFYRKKKRGERR